MAGIVSINWAWTKTRWFNVQTSKRNRNRANYKPIMRYINVSVNSLAFVDLIPCQNVTFALEICDVHRGTGASILYGGMKQKSSRVFQGDGNFCSINKHMYTI